MVITLLIYKGQLPYQILINHPKFDMSVNKLYSYLNNDVFTSRNINLKWKSKIQTSNMHKSQIKDGTYDNF